MSESDNSIIEAIRSVGGDNGRLSVEQKVWLGSQVVGGLTTVMKLSEQSGLRHRTIKRYAFKVRRGSIFKARPGRSRLLDEESMNSIQHWASDNECLTDEDNLSTLVEKINDEKVQTIIRRVESDDSSDVGRVRRVSQRSLRRYLRIFLQG